ncbi:DUF3558 domain-containing protein [Streptomyces triticagri]|uniref:DUF3558 domain-containing protein n=1 Tax=Streptomyces triticagri TaxID=2293568 RepID=A0A372LX17_9ACTN|nr:DUF3558 domain-containing protein [Streptomyces triticagri]RFU82845.1 DUF3558 domain-containing protein [Streptomyces triticagri]
MRRKGYVPGAAALLAVLLGGCTSGSGLGDEAGDSKPGGTDSSTPAAAPGKYRTLPDPCRTPDRGTLDTMLPGIKAAPEPQREKLYDGEATVTYDTDRLVGCRWKVESAQASHHLRVGFERVVSYDASVSDDELAEKLYLEQELAADLPAPSPSGSADPDTTPSGTGKDSKDGAKPGEGGKTPATTDPDGDGAPEGDGNGNGNSTGSSDSSSKSDESPDPAASGDPSTPPVPEGLEPRVLDGLADQAFVDDKLSAEGAAARHRTVTVVFRTSNVIVTVEYDEQPARGTEVPDSKEMQDTARELASKMAARFAE